MVGAGFARGPFGILGLMCGIRLVPKIISESVVYPGFVHGRAFARVGSVGCFVRVGSVSCFRLRWFRLLLSLASIPSVAFVGIGSVNGFRLCWFPLLLSFASVPSDAFVWVASACCIRCELMSYVASRCDVRVSCFDVGSFCCFRLRWLCLLFSFASDPSVTFVCVGFRSLLQFVLVSVVAFVCVGPLC